MKNSMFCSYDRITWMDEMVFERTSFIIIIDKYFHKVGFISC